MRQKLGKAAAGEVRRSLTLALRACPSPLQGEGESSGRNSILFEAGKAKFAGAFPALEDELAAFTPAGWKGSGAGPDRADAMIWAITELAVKPQRAEPRARSL